MSENRYRNKKGLAAFSVLALMLVAGTSSITSSIQSAYAANTLTVNGYALDGRPLNMWIVISLAGTTVKTGFTPLTFAGTTGSIYSVQAHDYSAGNIVFDHWEDGSTTRTRTITLSSDATITAFYKAPPPPNRAPVAVNDTAVVDQDKSVTVNVLANDSDPDGNSLAVSSTTSPLHGSVVVNSNGTITYTPVAKFSGQDSFSYTISDGNGGSASATVNIQVNFVNYAPIANDQTVNTSEDISLPIALGATDANGDPLTFSIASQPSHGSLSPASGNSNFTYTPNLNYNGQDSFTFKANDGRVDSNLATVSVTVIPVNDAPVASDQTASGNEDSTIPITLAASDVDGDSLSYSVTSNPSQGVLGGTAPNLVYTPNPNFNGLDSFAFVANDGALNSNSANVTINISAVNDAPLALAGSIVTNEDTASNILLNATDVDGDVLSYAIVQNPAHGTLTQAAGSSDGFTYMPSANYNGQDNFTFKANDGNLDSNTATVVINVTPVNDNPVATNDSATMNQDTSVTINALANDTDVDGDKLKVVSTTIPPHGSVTIATDGSTITYKPASGFYGIDSFTYTISDGNGGTSTATVSLTVKFVPSTYTLTVNSVDMYGKAASGLYTVISKSGSTVKTGFTPLSFVGSAGATYSVTVSDYSSTLFDHWQDNGSTTRAKSLVLNTNTTATAVFRVPTVTVSPTSGANGTSITASGTYFTPNSSISVMYDSNTVASATTNSAGAFTASFKSPALGTGYHTIQAVDGKGWKGSVKFQDTTPPPPHPLAYMFPKTGVYVALYMYPSGDGATQWQKVYDQKVAHPSVPIVAAFNPNSGAGTSKDPTMANWVAKLKSVHVIMIGYTYDNYGTRSLTDLKADANNYKNWYSADGLFIDEFTNKVGYESHYSSVTSYVKSIGMNMTMGNPGTDVPKSYVGTVDVLNITEGAGYMPISWLQYCVQCSADQGWHYQYDKRYFAYMRYNITSLDTTFETDSANWVGLLYITDGNDSNGRWFALPQYFGTLVAALDK